MPPARDELIDDGIEEAEEKLAPSVTASPRRQRRMRPQGDWTVFMGLRRAVAFLMLRSIVCLPVLTAQLWVATFAWRASLPMVLAGVSLGAVFGHRLNERTGFTGGPATVLALLVAWVVAIAAVMIAASFQAFDVVSQAFSAAALGAGATVVIMAMTLFDD